jgi:hypothetical protein
MKYLLKTISLLLFAFIFGFIGFILGTTGFSSKFDINHISSIGTIATIGILTLTLIWQFLNSKKEKINTQFYELLKYHHTNSNEIELTNPFELKTNQNREVHGKKCFMIIYRQYKLAKQILDYYEHIPKKGNIQNKLLNTSTKHYKKFSKGVELNDFCKSEIAYIITYHGVSSEAEYDLLESLQKNYTKEFVTDILKYFRLFPVHYSDCYKKSDFEILSDNNTEEHAMRYLLNLENKYSNKTFVAYFFGGHLHRLDHYFRHLFHFVNFIYNDSILSEEERQDYYKILRTQLSTYEQVLFYINSQSCLGRDWELTNDKKQKLITETKLTKNMPKNMVADLIQE